jgi:hypothetical protein
MKYKRKSTSLLMDRDDKEVEEKAALISAK